jgi:hypothetical protein
MNRPFTSAEYGPSYSVEEYRPDLCDLLAAEWEQQEAVGRHFRLSPSGLNRLRRFIASRFDPGRVVGALCLAIVVFNIVYFGGQLLRVFL